MPFNIRLRYQCDHSKFKVLIIFNLECKGYLQNHEYFFVFEEISLII